MARWVRFLTSLAVVGLLSGCGGGAAKAPAPELPSIQASADHASITAGESLVLSWTAANATTVTLQPGGQTLPANGSVTLTPTDTTTYTLTAVGSGGNKSATVTIIVTPPTPSPMITLTASATSIVAGAKVTLNWTSQQAVSVTLDNGIGAVSLNGSVEVSPAASTIYTAIARDAAATTKTAQVSVRVLPNGLANLRHIIFLIQENRTFDHYFGLLGQYRAARGLPDDVDGLDLANLQKYAQKDKDGNTVLLYHQRSVCVENTSPSWNPTHNAYNNGIMDGFVSVKEIPSTIDPLYHRVMGYYDATDIPYYYELATQFATSDRFFASVMAGTLANRTYLFAATSAGHIYSEDQIPVGGWPVKTIFELLRDYNVSWRYYYQDNSVFLGQFAAWQDPRITSNVWPISDWYATLAKSTADEDLPSVIFIEHAAATERDEHPGANMQAGAAVVANILNPLFQSPAWPSSVFILSHDDPGGLYDHVAPYSVPAPDNIAPIASITPTLPGDFTLSGFRLPLLVISPWAKPHFVSHVPREFTSILKLIEVRFGLPSLTARDAAADDMTEFFDFTRPARLTPPQLPPQPTNGICNWNLEVSP
jgi:phospholipase C